MERSAVDPLRDGARFGRVGVIVDLDRGAAHLALESPGVGEPSRRFRLDSVEEIEGAIGLQMTRNTPDARDLERALRHAATVLASRWVR